ncbi:MAG: hypothetical protein KGM17_14340 [Sphingomonadales bacterium]|nr:hypothetical protein [Sphingomonadales bacterium]
MTLSPIRPFRPWRSAVLLLAAALSGAAEPPTPNTLATIDLAAVAGAPGWWFTATQGARVPDPVGVDDLVPGPIRLCISRDRGRTCGSAFAQVLGRTAPDDVFAEPHFLNDARIVEPRRGLRLLLVSVSSVHAVNGDQRVATVALGHGRNGFAPVFSKVTRRNNNQEIRYIAAGPLRGAFIIAEPTQDAPFGFWISVEMPGGQGRYRQVQHFRSATRYGDGNPLAVIDSEMPAILQRAGAWHPGAALPLPARGCPAPHLVRGALWC